MSGVGRQREDGDVLVPSDAMEVNSGGVADINAEPVGLCRHCGQNVVGGALFCCSGCAGAYGLVHDLGLDAYYRRRSIDPSQPALKPEADAAEVLDFAAFIRTDGDATASIDLVVEGLHCAACVWLIESVLARQPGVVRVRVNMTSRRLSLSWRPAEADPVAILDPVRRLGYRFVPFDARLLAGAEAEQERFLLRAMAVAGFAFGNVMLLSIAVWAGHGDMGPATRTLMHWLSALIALPAIAYAGRAFFRPALAALRRGHTNMDVPISLGVILASAMSLHETIRGAEHAYFESAVGLLFFLLIGRYLDRRARGRARSSAGQLMMLNARAVTVVADDGTTQIVAPAAVRPGARVLVAAGERIPVDGRVTAGETNLDSSLIDGESTPKPAGPGTRVFAGTLNLTAPIRITVGAVGEATLLAEISRLVEAAEQRRSRYVIIADRIARAYTPFVHATALLTFLGWWQVTALPLGVSWGVPWQTALLHAVAVLIITCPCALALAVPVVQVLAVGRLLRRGILVKSGTALERIAAIDTVVFDKTGTLTEGRPQLLDPGAVPAAVLARAAAIASHSRHPLARALVRARQRAGLAVVPVDAVGEVPGQGLQAETGDGISRLGRRGFAAAATSPDGDDDNGDDGDDAAASELWFTEPGRAPVRFRFADRLRADAGSVIAWFRASGRRLVLLSGDRASVVAQTAQALALADWRAQLMPADKVAAITDLGRAGRRVLMVGDGLNDAPALAAAFASMSPTSAADVSQTAADVVFQGDRLAPVAETLDVAIAAGRLSRQNLILAFAYNAVTVPLAVLGLVTPLVAAIAMSTSSLVVIMNALRLNRVRS
ncbi:MAG: heavy metal translocating P-type ATPase metal-binding domain-containing protein [Rhodospirillales bacterium]